MAAGVLDQPRRRFVGLDVSESVALALTPLRSASGLAHG